MTKEETKTIIELEDKIEKLEKQNNVLYNCLDDADLIEMYREEIDEAYEYENKDKE